MVESLRTAIVIVLSLVIYLALKFSIIQNQLKDITVTIGELTGKIDGLASDTSAKLGDISKEIADLKAAGGATPEQLDALGGKVDAIDAAVKGFSTT